MTQEFATFCAVVACGLTALVWLTIVTLAYRPRPPLPVQEDLSELFL